MLSNLEKWGTVSNETEGVFDTAVSIGKVAITKRVDFNDPVSKSGEFVLIKPPDGGSRGSNNKGRYRTRRGKRNRRNGSTTTKRRRHKT